MHGRPRKNKVKELGENNSQVSRVGKQIRCSNCQSLGHNKASREKESVPKPPIVKKVPGRRREPELQNASAKGGGRGSKGGGLGAESGGRGVVGGGRGVESGGRATMGGGRG
ncbi:hypothetical protein Tco_1325320, partial [Tanacetum coccineum]